MKMLQVPISFLTDNTQTGEEEILQHLRDQWKLIGWAFSQQDMRKARIITVPEPSEQVRGEQHEEAQP